ncbi:hypothetical protein NMY22_g4298 [Coprinellus aureogranulatus]|nr:hypothetical protein NMY22_g4298 [Coprinellus aureogranulatus]
MPLSQTFDDCVDTDCLCKTQNNQVLLRCVECLYRDVPEAQTFDVAQQTLKDLSVVCIDYGIEELSLSTGGSTSASATSRPPSTASTPPQPTTPTAGSASSAYTGSLSTIPRTSSSTTSKSGGTPLSTSPATTSTLPEAPQQCHLVYHRKQRVLLRRRSH